MTENVAAIFEVIDLSSGNVVNDFADASGALASIRRIAERHGWEAVQNVALMHLDGDDLTLVAMQASLADLAASMEHPAAASRAR